MAAFLEQNKTIRVFVRKYRESCCHLGTPRAYNNGTTCYKSVQQVSYINFFKGSILLPDGDDLSTTSSSFRLLWLPIPQDFQVISFVL